MRRWGVVAGVAVVVGAVAVPTVSASAADLPNANVHLQTVATKLKRPLALGWRTGDPTMYVAEQVTGRIRPIVNGRPKGNMVKIKVLSGAEQGLLGFTFSPNGQKLYVDFTGASNVLHVDEYQMSGSKAVKKTVRPIISYPHPFFGNHNGGNIAFGPDNQLYIGWGDGGGGGDPNNNAQNKGRLLGKILRINPTANPFAPYFNPGGNPFVGTPGARGEVWMYGLRNPWRWSFDRLTGDMWIGDVGQDNYEEIDYAPAGLQAGANWGWNLREGFHQYSGAQPPGGRDPIIERPHTAGDCAITGGYVYRGSAIPALSGAYVYGDYCTGNVFAAVQSGGVITSTRQLPINVPLLTSFGQDPSGELYATSDNGSVYKIVP